MNQLLHVTAIVIRSMLEVLKIIEVFSNIAPPKNTSHATVIGKKKIKQYDMGRKITSLLLFINLPIATSSVICNHLFYGPTSVIINLGLDADYKLKNLSEKAAFVINTACKNINL